MEPLIERSERIEQAAWTDLYEGAGRRLTRALGLGIEHAASGTRLSATQADHLLLNRAIGLRPEGTSLEKAIDDVLQHYRRRKTRRFWVQLGSDQRHGPMPLLLASRGITRYPRSWMKFVRASQRMATAQSTASIRSARQEDAETIARLLSDGFDLPPDGGSLLASGVAREPWHYFVVADDAEPIAAAALYVSDGDGYLAFAATNHLARRRGLQRALMKARLDVAATLGCRWVFTETGLPVAGEPNSSYRNMLRLGFDELCVRDNFAPEGTQWLTLPSSDADAKSSASP